MFHRSSNAQHAPSHDIAPDYFKTWGIPLLAGRVRRTRHANGQKVCLISQAGAKKLNPNENPIGKTLLVSSLSVPYENRRHRGRCSLDPREGSAGDGILHPWAQENFPFRERHGAEQSESRRRHAARAVRAFESLIRDCGCRPAGDGRSCRAALGQARLMTWLLGIFAGVALLLASIGIYGARCLHG